jgi:multicomponent Na+:H+ antiporter subunit E
VSERRPTPWDRHQRVRYVLALLWLTLVWVLLWNDLSVANVLGGLLAGAFVLVLFPLFGSRGTALVRPLHVVRFVAYFVFLVVKANLQVAYAVLRPSIVREAIVAVRVTSAGDWLLVLLANCITLTPGTLSVDLRRQPDVLYIHTLLYDDAAVVRRDVLLFERSILRAFGKPEAVAAVEAQLAAGPDVWEREVSP